MAKKNRYPGLTKEQRIQLKALIAEVVTLPTANVLRESLRLRGVDCSTKEGLVQCDQVMAGVMAFEKLLPYLAMLRFFNAERQDIGKQIYDYMQHPYPTHESEVSAKAHAELMAAQLAGAQEVRFHFFCITVQHVHAFLKHTAKAAGHWLPDEDIQFLDHYRDLRNHYEHFYNRLPGGTHEAAVLTKTVNNVEYRVRGGIDVDSFGRLVVKVPEKGKKKEKPVLVEKTFDVTQRGMNKINEIVERNWRDIRRKAVDQLREHFIANPESIPSPDDVQFELMISPGGYKPAEA